MTCINFTISTPMPCAVKRTLFSTSKYVQINLKQVLFHMLILTTRNTFYLYMSILAHYLWFVPLATSPKPLSSKYSCGLVKTKSN